MFRKSDRKADEDLPRSKQGNEDKERDKTEFLNRLSLATRTVHAGYHASTADNNTLMPAGPLVPPLYLATTYDQTSQDEYLYSRVDNPNRKMLEGKLAALEGAQFGAVFSSGMAAVNAVVAACCSAGDHVIVVGQHMYPGTIACFKSVVSRFGISVTWAEADQLTASLGSLIKPLTKFVWIETLSNPMLIMMDIKAISKNIRAAALDGTKAPYLVVDNTFMTPYFMNPLKFGADLVIHSGTKYLNGHGDVLLGAVLTNNEPLAGELRWMQQELGGVPSPFDCYLTLRGLKTLHLRMERVMETGLKLAKFLEKHPCVSEVIHPGLPSYGYKDLLLKQSRGFPGMLAFVIKGSEDEALDFARNLKVATYATSLGACETLVCLTRFMLEPTLRQVGIFVDWMKHPSLVRVSVGLESPEDLIADFDQSLRSAVSKLSACKARTKS